tara:strand:+ start:8956 stop:10227 length:1272 start_codon:yes stop_codon:yes gene_type:complete
MGFSSSKSKSKQVSGPSPTQTKAANILLEAIVPGSSGIGGYVQQGQQPSQQMQTQTSLPYEGEGSVPSRMIQPATPDGSRVGYGYEQGMKESQANLGDRTFSDVIGKGVVRSPNQLTPQEAGRVSDTLLPSMTDMRFKTMGEQMELGRGTDEERQIIAQQEAMAADPIKFAQEVQDNIVQKVYAGQALELPTTPEITDYISDVYNKLPESLKGLVDDVVTKGTNANIDTSITAASEKLLAQAQQTGDKLMKDTLGRFSAAGAATSGAAIAAASQITSEIAVNFGAELVNFTQTAMQQAQQDRQIALQALNQITTTADRARAQDLQADIINLETLNTTLGAQLNSYVQLTQSFLQNSQFYTDIIANQFNAMSSTDVENFRMVYEVLVSLATGGPGSSYGKSTSKSFGLDFGGLISGNLDALIND